MDVMLDFETLGTDHDAVLCSAGLVRFNIETGEILATAHCFADLRSALSHNRIVDPETLLWWLSQATEAQVALAEGMRNHGMPWTGFLSHIREFIGDSREEDGNLRLWSNGATFDVSLLEYALKQENLRAPWKYSAARDMRTLVDIAKPFEHSVVLEGTKHDALADAVYQAKVVSQLWRHVKGLNNV